MRIDFNKSKGGKLISFAPNGEGGGGSDARLGDVNLGTFPLGSSYNIPASEFELDGFSSVSFGTEDIDYEYTWLDTILHPEQTPEDPTPDNPEPEPDPTPDPEPDKPTPDPEPEPGPSNPDPTPDPEPEPEEPDNPDSGTDIPGHLCDTLFVYLYDSSYAAGGTLPGPKQIEGKTRQTQWSTLEGGTTSYQVGFSYPGSNSRVGSMKFKGNTKIQKFYCINTSHTDITDLSEMFSGCTGLQGFSSKTPIPGSDKFAARIGRVNINPDCYDTDGQSLKNYIVKDSGNTSGMFDCTYVNNINDIFKGCTKLSEAPYLINLGAGMTQDFSLDISETQISCTSDIILSQMGGEAGVNNFANLEGKGITGWIYVRPSQPGLGKLTQTWNIDEPWNADPDSPCYKAYSRGWRFKIKGK